MKHALPLLALLLPACLENEEEIEVHPNGSVHVTLKSGGDPSDLDDGYALPLDPAWRSGSADTDLWLSRIGSDTGSAATREALERFDWPKKPGEDRARADLAVSRELSRLEDVPSSFASEKDPYRTAYLQRTGTLTIRKVGARTVYVFERTYHGRDHARFQTLARAFESLPEELQQRFEDEEPISPAEWELTAGVVREAYRESAQLFARDAVLGVFTQGDAALDPHSVEGIVASVGGVVADVISVPRLMRLYDATKDSAAESDDEPSPFESLENNVRSVLRETLARSLADASVAEPTRNAILFALEWGFTSYDHTVDLADENFEVSVTLPGTLVGGNFESSSASTARWEFEGQELDDRDVVMRAVSVLD